MPQLDREMVKARASRLREAAAARRRKWLQGLVGTTQRVLIENGGKGHADNFASVIIEGASRGDTGQAIIAARNGDFLTAAWA